MNPGLLGSIETGVAAVDTVIFACLLVGLIVCLAMEEKLHAKKSVIAGTFAITCLLLGTIRGVLPFDDVVVGSHQITSHEGIEGNYQGTTGRKLSSFLEPTTNRTYTTTGIACGCPFTSRASTGE